MSTFKALMNTNEINVNKLHIEIPPNNGTDWYNLESTQTILQ